ncbi:hypothetical protein, partial [Paracoccus sp. (in: a-proteobacteria)]|uniref:hypothetical protein n=1 Tax=Paracoccus sp. TaxID=267 RepID=UPI0026DF56BC
QWRDDARSDGTAHCPNRAVAVDRCPPALPRDQRIGGESDDGKPPTNAANLDGAIEDQGATKAVAAACGATAR